MRKPACPSSNSYRGYIYLQLRVIVICILCLILLVSIVSPVLARRAVSAAPSAANQQASTILFQENFDDGSTQGFGNDSGAWKVVDGKYTATAGTARFSTAGDLSWQDYTIEADYLNARDGGLLVRTQDYKNLIALVIRPTYNDISWNIRKGGNWGSGLNAATLGHQPGENLHVKIEVSGSQFKGYINGELITTLETAEFPKGKIGLYLYSSGEQYWDNVVVSTGSAAATTTPPPTKTATARGLIDQATLKNGDYGGGSAISPTTGVVNSSNGVSYISTESNKQSSGLVNWEIPSNRRAQFCSQGTVSFLFKADRQSFINGEILGDNYGYGQYNNGQSTFSVAAYRIANSSGTDDDQFYLKWSTWHGGTWVTHPPAGESSVVLEFDKSYYLGFVWGGPSNTFEIWVSGDLKENDSQAGAALPWGSQLMGTGTGTNIGLGSNHQRGISNYGSAAGVTFANIHIWDEYKTNGDTQSVSGSEPTLTATTTKKAAPTQTPGVTSTGTATLTFESRNETSGSTVQVPLSLKGAQDKIGNMDISLKFDTSVLQAVEVTKGSLTANSIFDSNIQNDTIKISLADKQGFGGDGTIAYISFKVTGSEGSTSTLHIASATANRAADFSPANLSTRDGTFTVVSVAELRKHLTVLDALRALKMAVGKLAVDLALDVNGDGKVTSADARLILQLAVGNTPEPVSPTTSTSSPSQLIVTGTSTKIASQTIAVGGGTMTINKPNDPLNGLTIEIPPGAYQTPVEFTISESPILQVNMAYQVKAASSLITIENGGGYASDLITVKIPVKAPADQFAMGFIYDPETQSFEGLPTVAEDETSITVATRHFCNMGVLFAARDYLDQMKAKMTTKFVPGEDTWNLPNVGSYISPGGFCQGLTLSELYYFLKEKPVTGEKLWKADNGNGLPADMQTPGFWQDDRWAIQLCSECSSLAAGSEKDSDIGNYSKFLKMFLRPGASNSDDAFRQTVFSLLVTGQPQLLAIWNTQTGQGHSLICYGVNKDQLLVADPDYPDRRDLSIIYDVSKKEFHPYFQADSVQDAVAGKIVKYDLIRYAGLTSYFNFPSLRKLWTDFNSGARDSRFPHYDIWVNELDSAGKSESRYGLDLANGKTVNAKSLKFEVDAKFNAHLVVYRYGDLTNPISSDKVDLQPGDNYLGLYVTGSYGGQFWWVGFDWMKITLNEATSATIPASSLQGPAAIFSTVTGETDYWDTLKAGTIAINIQPSGTVAGTWSGQSRRNDLFYDFSSNLTGQVTLSKTQPDSGTVEVTGTYTIREHTADNSFTKTFTGKMRLYFDITFLPSLKVVDVIDMIDLNKNESIGQWTPSG